MPAVSIQTVSPRREGVVSPGSMMTGMAMWGCGASSEVGSATAVKKLVIRVCWRSCTVDGGMRSWPRAVVRAGAMSTGERHSPKGIRNVAGQLWSTQSKGIPMPKVFEAKTIRNPKGLQFTVGSPQFLARRWRSRVVVGLSPTAAG